MNRYCSSCRRGENKIEADVFVKGHTGEHPFRGYLCQEHLELMLDDGAELIIEYVSHKAKQERVNELLQKHTFYGSWKEAVRNNASIRNDMGVEHREMIKIIKDLSGVNLAS